MSSGRKFRIRTLMVLVAVVALLIPVAMSVVRYVNRPRYWNIVITKKIEIVNPMLLRGGNAIRIGRDSPRGAEQLRNFEAGLQRRGVEYRIESN
jgi:hypothetical protein